MGGSDGANGFGTVGRPGGGGGGGGGGAPRTQKFDCVSYEATVTLKSPQPPVTKLKKNDVLVVELHVESSASSIVAVNEKGEIAGAIVVPEQLDLEKCIKRGTRYEATVLSIAGGSCVVHIAAENE